MNDLATQHTSSNANGSHRPTLKHLFYAIALLGASIAVWGAAGIAIGVYCYFGWWFILDDKTTTGRLVRAAISVTLAGMIWALIGPWFIMMKCPPEDYCKYQLKEISIALLNYAASHRQFPPAIVVDANGKPAHSWRVLLLPYLGEQELYDTYNFDQSWDSPANLAIARKHSPFGISCPSNPRAIPLTHTNYFAITGLGTAFPDSSSSKLLDVIGENRSPPLYLIEDHSRDVLWTEPVDLTSEEAVRLLSNPERPAPHAMGEFPYEVTIRNGAFANGRMEYIRAGISAENARALISIDDGSGASQQAMRQAIYRPRRPWWERFAAGLAFTVVLGLPIGWMRHSR